MRNVALVLLAITIPAFSGCIIEVASPDDPISPAPFPDDESSPGNPGIAPGEPNPNAPREGFRDLYAGEWCYYEDRVFDGRVFPDEKAFAKTWNDFIACDPEADLDAVPKVDWEREFVVALIAQPSGCTGALLNVTHASPNDGRYLVQYDHDTNDGMMCATAMSRPIKFIGMDRAYSDSLLVDFVEVEQP